MVIKMSNESGRPWYKSPATMVPIIVAIMGAVGVIIAAYIGIIPFMGDERATVTVQGIVTDNDGKPVVGASVEIDGSSATTGSDGGYVIHGVPINTKTITVRALGGEVVTQQALRISEGVKIIRYDVNLPLSVTPISPTPTPMPTPTTSFWSDPLSVTQSPIPTPDLFVSEFSLDPATPIQGDPVSVRVGVYNQGNDKSGAFTVQWWAGENFKEPACTWQVDSLAAGGGRILTCTYDGYPSWYGSLTAKVVVDSAEEVAESDEENNMDRMTISVIKPSGVHIVFDALPDGTPISSDLILKGDEFLSKGIRLEGAPEGTYCSDAVAAIRRPGTYTGINFNFLTTSRPDNVKSCNGVPVAIIFEKQVHHVTLTFAGASTTYTMKAYDSAGNLLGTVEQDALLNGGTFEVTFSSKSANINISRVTFGRAAAVTAIKEIYYER
jgi:hypothetical protein